MQKLRSSETGAFWLCRPGENWPPNLSMITKLSSKPGRRKEPQRAYTKCCITLGYDNKAKIYVPAVVYQLQILMNKDNNEKTAGCVACVFYLPIFSISAI
jgi:hypothetical protein